MTRIFAPNTNCFQAFMACMFNQDLLDMQDMSTVHDNWAEATNRFLAGRGLFFVEVHRNAVSVLPNESIVGAHVDGEHAKHIVIAKVKQSDNGCVHRFEVWHDPSGRFKVGDRINPNSLVLFCELLT